MSVFRGECHQHNVKSMFLRMADATKTFLYSEKILIQKDTYTPIFTGILFTIASTWKQPKYPLTDEWIKMWCKWNTSQSLKRTKEHHLQQHG